jgi:Protein of unknown function (DUF2585)
VQRTVQTSPPTAAWMNDSALSRPRSTRERRQQGPSRFALWACGLITAVLLALLVAVLLLMGRPLWCECGYVKLWHGVVMSAENSQRITDWYTFSHLVHGFALYGAFWLVVPRRPIELRFVLALVVEVAWEIVENTDFVIDRYRAATIALDYYGDSAINSAADVLACALGLLLAARLPVWGTLMLAVAIEAILAYAIRDNLTLNIIMLVYPFESIKQWQLGN